MKKTIRETVQGIGISHHIITVLTENYCNGFLPVSVIREGKKSLFSYDSSYYLKPEFEKMNTLEKLELINELLEINDECEERMIGGDTYVINKDVVFRRVGISGKSKYRLMYYPDFERRSFTVKMVEFISAICDRTNETETESLDSIIIDLKSGDMWRTRRRLSRIAGRYSIGL